jgi:hypothetical protein
MALPMQVPSDSTTHQVVIEIGGIPIGLQTTDVDFVGILNRRYGDYVRPGVVSDFKFRVELVPPGTFNPDDDAEVLLHDGEWQLQRGDFQANWNPVKHQGQISQSANPYSIDSVLRIVHTLMLAPAGGFLLHASSAVRNGKAFLFSGLSEAGKTTIARLAPSDVVLLTDEASYVRRTGGEYLAFGTPFAGELGEPGKNISAPIAALYFLHKATENRIEPVTSVEAIRRLLRNILFFARDAGAVQQVFESACAFVAAVPVFQLSFLPDQRVWDLIG